MQVNLILTEQELDIIGAALNEMPYKIVKDLLPNISQQYEMQKKDLSNKQE